ncbi:AAA family ATPase [Actinomadura sp. WMMA1423]|uniref:AAA family ATPase n=1 Tax=Actinomadura sp. WMMA1423 TaxID=2591108 RepID=UPI001146590E|nr:AAA family ATPase [Actinomadura sp. WMMA1423]
MEPVPQLESAVMLVTGIMASGKSTVAQLLAERLPRSVHLRGDSFRRMIVSGREEMTSEPTPEAVEQLRLRYRASATVADLYAQAGWTVIVQDVVLGGFLDDYVAAVTTRPMYVVVLAPDPEVVAAREAGRGKRGYGDAWTVRALDAGLRRETPRRGLWMDTSTQTPDQTVDAILTDLPKAQIHDQ